MVSKKKSTKLPKPRHSTHPSTNPSRTSSSSIILSSFSPTYLRLSLFASTILGLGSQRLRVHDTLTGKLRCEYAFDKGAVCNSLTWGTLATEDCDGDGKSKKQKKRKRLSPTDGDSMESGGTAILALGMNKGSILLYSPTEGTLVGSLDGGHIGETTCFKFARKSIKGWSCGTDGKLVEWDLKRKIPLSIIPLPDPSIRILAPIPPAILCASHTVYSINPDTPGDLPKFAANATPVHGLLVSSDANYPHFLTYADSDRYINVFSIPQQQQVGALVAESDVKHVSTNLEHGGEGLEVLGATTADGLVEIFTQPWEPALAASLEYSSTGSRKVKGTTRKADSRIRVIRPNTKEPVPIINISFQTGGELVFAWAERGVHIEFDRIKWQNTKDGSLMLNGLIEITKAKSHALGSGTAGATQMNGVKDLGKSYVDQSRTVVVSGVATKDIGVIDPGDASDNVEKEDSGSENESDSGSMKLVHEEPSFSDKFQVHEALATNTNATASSQKFPNPITPTGKRGKRYSGSLATVLTQALRTDDAHLLESCLLSTDSKAIVSTVQRLDSTYAVKLIEKLSERIARRPGRAASLGVWIRWIIVAHGGYLLSLPNLMMTLAGLHSTLATRAGALPKLLQLQGRLEMLNAQLELRNNLRKGIGETGVDLTEEEQQIEEGVLYIEGKTKDDNGESDDNSYGSDEEPEEVGMEGLQIEDASFIQGKLDGSDDGENEEEEEGAEEDLESVGEQDRNLEDDEYEEDEERVNGVPSSDSEDEEDEDTHESEDEEAEDDDADDDDDEVVERYGGLIDDEAEETDDDDGAEEDTDGGVGVYGEDISESGSEVSAKNPVTTKMKVPTTPRKK